MRCRAPREEQIERPTRFLEPAVLALVEERPEEVIETLSAVVTDDRRERIEQVLDHRTRSVVVVLDHIYDPHNSAAVLRTAEALGLQEVHTIDPAGELPLSRRVTQGCHKWLDLVCHDDTQSCVDSLRRRGYKLLGATEKADRTPADHAGGGKVALCMGNEHEGLSPELAASCDGFVGIPMVGFTRSLNVSVATALLLSEILRGRPRGFDGGERAIVKARYYALSVRAVRALLERQGLLEGR